MVMSKSCACEKKIKKSMLISQLSRWSLRLQQRAPHLTGLGMQRQRANSRIRCERVTRCSRGTPGRPPASLWGSRSPSSPRRRSSRQGGVGRGEEEGEGPTTEFRTDCFNFCLSRGRWNGNKSWEETTWENKVSEKRKKKTVESVMNRKETQEVHWEINW